MHVSIYMFLMHEFLYLSIGYDEVHGKSPNGAMLCCFVLICTMLFLMTI